MPRSAAVLASVAVESLLTGLGAGGFLLAHTRRGRTICSTSSSRPAGAASTPRAGASWLRSRCVFDETPQMFNIGPASCGVPGTPAGLWEVSRRFGSMPLRELAKPAVKLRARGGPV